MLRMQHIKTVNSSTMLFINHTIDTSSSRWHSLSVYCNWRNRKFYYYYSKNKNPGVRERICAILRLVIEKCLLYTYLLACVMVIKKFSVDHHIFCNSKWANPFQDPEMGQQFLTHSQNGSKPETGRNINMNFSLDINKMTAIIIIIKLKHLVKF